MKRRTVVRRDAGNPPEANVPLHQGVSFVAAPLLEQRRPPPVFNSNSNGFYQRFLGTTLWRYTKCHPVRMCEFAPSNTMIPGSVEGFSSKHADGSTQTNKQHNDPFAVTENGLIELKLGKSQRRLAVIVKKENNSTLRVVDSRGQSIRLMAKKMTFHLHLDEIIPWEKLEDLEQVAQSLVHDIVPKLKALWKETMQKEKTASSSSDISLETSVNVIDVAAFAFSASQPSVEQIYASHLALLKNNTYFKEKKPGIYLLREPGQVAVMEIFEREVTQSEQAKKSHIDEILALRRSVGGPGYQAEKDKENAGKHPYVVPVVISQALLSALQLISKEIDSKSRHSTTWYDLKQNMIRTEIRDEITKLLQGADLPCTPDGAFRLLIDLGIYGEHESVCLKNTQFESNEFAPNLMDVANLCLLKPQSDEMASLRKDFCFMNVFAIDGECTKEVDDGISIERDSQGNIVKFWIHVADPLRWVDSRYPLNDRQGSALLVEEAFHRATTVYFPDGERYMFPEALSTELFSLAGHAHFAAHEPQVTLSFGFELAEDGSIRNGEIVPACISGIRLILYDDADKVIQASLQGEAGGDSSRNKASNMSAELEKDLIDLYAAAMKIRAFRIHSGGIAAHVPSSRAIVSRDMRFGAATSPESTEHETIRVIVSAETESQMTVSEFMVCAGAIAGEFCRKHEILAPFRSQPKAQNTVDSSILAQIPDGVPRYMAMLRGSMPSKVGLTPERHASLALPAYIQSSSPIRRAADLISHHQIRSFMLGKKSHMYERQVLKDLLNRVSETTREARQLEARSNRYWILTKLKMMGPSARHRGVVVRIFGMEDDDNLLKETTKNESCLLFLSDYAISIMGRVQAGVVYGEQVEVSVLEVDPRSAFVKSLAYKLPY